MAIGQKKQRHQARRYAIQALYQYHFNRSEVNELQAQFMVDNAHVKVDWGFFKLLTDGVVNQRLDLDSLFLTYVDGGLKSINAIELAILRCAACELTQLSEIPYKVILNEYIELTKEYGATEGHAFVNGVLEQLAKQVREVEYQHGKS